MKSYNVFAALCGATVLSLSLISCNGKDPQIKPAKGDAWGLAEPSILTADGVEVKYGEANTKQNLTFTVDYRLVMNGVKYADDKVTLNFTTHCVRGGERFQLTHTYRLQPEYTLFNFMPAAIFYAKDGQPLAGVNCSLSITAENSNKSRHAFPVLNLPMADGGTANLDLYLDSQKISTKEVQNLTYAQAQALELPPISAEETITLHCASFVKASTDKYVRDISDLKIVQGQVRGDERRPQVCRVIKSRGDVPLALSPFFNLRFIDTESLLTLVDNSPVLTRIHAQNFPAEHVWIPRHRVYLRQRLKNIENEIISVRIPKFYPVRIEIPTVAGIYDAPISLEVTPGSHVVGHTETHYLLQLKKNESTEISYKVPRPIHCNNNGMYSTTLTATDPSISLAVMDENFKEIWAERPLVTDSFKLFYVDSDQVLPRNESRSDKICH